VASPGSHPETAALLGSLPAAVLAGAPA
jgi:hypothetical protein